MHNFKDLPRTKIREIIIGGSCHKYYFCRDKRRTLVCRDKTRLLSRQMYSCRDNFFLVISSSNWILMSCQPHRVTSGQSNSGHKQTHTSKLFSHTYRPSVKSIYKTNHFANMKHTHTNISSVAAKQQQQQNVCRDKNDTRGSSRH